jgi:hypothetical protein
MSDYEAPMKFFASSAQKEEEEEEEAVPEGCCQRCGRPFLCERKDDEDEDDDYVEQHQTDPNHCVDCAVGIETEEMEIEEEARFEEEENPSLPAFLAPPSPSQALLASPKEDPRPLVLASSSSSSKTTMPNNCDPEDIVHSVFGLDVRCPACERVSYSIGVTSEPEFVRCSLCKARVPVLLF